MVEAGAVAEESAARTTEKAKFKCRMKYVKMNTTKEAIKASKSVMTTTFIPFFFKTSKRKNSPVENAIKARAISGRNSMPVITEAGIRFKQKGPMRIPVKMYAVTFGRRSFFVIRVIKNPKKSIMETEIMTVATEEVFPPSKSLIEFIIIISLSY